MTTPFASLGLPAVLLDVLRTQGLVDAFPIQAATIPDALAGRDVLGRGRTGSGKTLAFSLPLVARLAPAGAERRRATPWRPRGLVLVPTRELANQVRDVIAPLARAARLRHAVVYGGVGYGPQIAALRDGVDLVVACPGRLLDLVGSGHARLDAVEVTVLDEADHMAELGFLNDVKKILAATPRRGQRLLYSATLDRGVDAIVRQYLDRPVTHEVDAVDATPDDLAHHVLHVGRDDRFAVIADLCAAPGRTIVFTRTKHTAKRMADQLSRAGVPAVDLHGNLSQAARARNLAAYSGGAVDTLVATDIAARGIHVDDVALVIHADPPAEHKAFLHRSGRTARAGAAGTVVTIMTDEQRRHVRDITRKAGIDPVVTRVTPDHPLLAELAPGERTRRERVERPAAPARPARPAHDRRGGGEDRRGGGRRRRPRGRARPGGR
ncbi:MAG: DEAD/DEAH box helicase [Ilumatobacteraceae bacterium]